MIESKAAIDLRRAFVAKEQRMLDRQELMGWTDAAGVGNGKEESNLNEQPPRKKRRLWEVVNEGVADKSDHRVATAQESASFCSHIPFAVWMDLVWFRNKCVSLKRGCLCGVAQVRQM